MLYIIFFLICIVIFFIIIECIKLWQTPLKDLKGRVVKQSNECVTKHSNKCIDEQSNECVTEHLGSYSSAIKHTTLQPRKNAIKYITGSSTRGASRTFSRQNRAESNSDFKRKMEQQNRAIQDALTQAENAREEALAKESDIKGTILLAKGGTESANAKAEDAKKAADAALRASQEAAAEKLKASKDAATKAAAETKAKADAEKAAAELKAAEAKATVERERIDAAKKAAADKKKAAKAAAEAATAQALAIAEEQARQKKITTDAELQASKNAAETSANNARNKARDLKLQRDAEAAAETAKAEAAAAKAAKQLADDIKNALAKELAYMEETLANSLKAENDRIDAEMKEELKQIQKLNDAQAKADAIQAAEAASAKEKANKKIALESEARAAELATKEESQKKMALVENERKLAEQRTNAANDLVKQREFSVSQAAITAEADTQKLEVLYSSIASMKKEAAKGEKEAAQALTDAEAAHNTAEQLLSDAETANQELDDELRQIEQNILDEKVKVNSAIRSLRTAEQDTIEAKNNLEKAEKAEAAAIDAKTKADALKEQAIGQLTEATDALTLEQDKLDQFKIDEEEAQKDLDKKIKEKDALETEQADEETAWKENNRQITETTDAINRDIEAAKLKKDEEMVKNTEEKDELVIIGSIQTIYKAHEDTCNNAQLQSNLTGTAADESIDKKCIGPNVRVTSAAKGAYKGDSHGDSIYEIKNPSTGEWQTLGSGNGSGLNYIIIDPKKWWDNKKNTPITLKRGNFNSYYSSDIPTNIDTVVGDMNKGDIMLGGLRDASKTTGTGKTFYFDPFYSNTSSLTELGVRNPGIASAERTQESRWSREGGEGIIFDSWAFIGQKGWEDQSRYLSGNQETTMSSCQWQPSGQCTPGSKVEIKHDGIGNIMEPGKDANGAWRGMGVKVEYDFNN